jgi:hypothetical protein
MSPRIAIIVTAAVAVLAAAVLAVGCGAATTTSPTAQPGSTAAGGSSASPTTATGGQPGALTGEAASAAAGDIPDNQAFLKLNDVAGGFTMKYPEGWAKKQSTDGLVIQDKNNIVSVSVTAGAQPTVAAVTDSMGKLAAGNASLKSGAPTAMTVSGAPAIKVTYSTVSAADPVTGKRVTLVVDRYYLWHNGRVAVVDLGTPQGVDNVDAYRLMIESFSWTR